MGSVYYGVHEEIALELAEKYDLKVFVETGTWHGDSARWASDKFSTVITIEVIEEYYLAAKESLRYFYNVSCLHGDSRVLLNNIMEQIFVPTLFWLDAHWDGHKDFSSELYGVCAVREEIAAINKSPLPHVIMIDDARLFPSMTGIEQTEVFALLVSGNRIVTIRDDIFFAEPIW